VPLGARELPAVGVSVLFPVLAGPQKAGKGGRAGMRERGPVVQAQVPRGVGCAVAGIVVVSARLAAAGSAAAIR
jgi:hypothetical protein